MVGSSNLRVQIHKAKGYPKDHHLDLPRTGQDRPVDCFSVHLSYETSQISILTARGLQKVAPTEFPSQLLLWSSVDSEKESSAHRHFRMLNVPHKLHHNRPFLQLKNNIFV